ncbi:metallophosphoesterase family protein [Thiovibrio sp. JS02]
MRKFDKPKIISKTQKEYQRILAMGDMHGCANHLRHLLDEVKPGKDDLVITLGDYIDRGADSKGVIDTLISLHRDPNINIVSLRGNHDAMLLMCFNGISTDEFYPSSDGCDEETTEVWEIVGQQEPAHLWFGNQGQTTLRSYCQGSEPEEIRVADLAVNICISAPCYQQDLYHLMAELIPQEHIEFLRDTCVDVLEMDNYIFVHGGLCADLPLADHPIFPLHLMRFDKTWQPHISGKKVICGHTPQPDLLIHDLGHAICIDTGVYMPKGLLSCVDVLAGQAWQIDGSPHPAQRPVVHYDHGRIPFVRISQLPAEEQKEFKNWIIGHNVPFAGCAWPWDYKRWRAGEEDKI